MDNRFFGGILLVAGTAIGAGMLALPVISGFAGFLPSAIALIVCWAFMFATAWLVLEVNLASSGDVNMISMASRTLGPVGRWVCWVSYLLLLYSLTAAYLAGSAPLFVGGIESLFGVRPPDWLGCFALLGLFGLFVYLGTRSVDRINRVLMMGLLVTYIALVCFVPPHVETTLLTMVNVPAIWVAVPVVVTSFGFHIIIPTLTTYLHHDRRKLRWTIFIGSIVPLLVYLLWEFLVLGTVPVEGLTAAWQAGESGAQPLAAVLQTPWIATVAKMFSFFAIITSFLGVSLSLSDFLGDGLKMHRFSWGREAVCLLTFVPPMVFVLTYQRGFMLALQYAGIFVAILLGVLPALMAWKLPGYHAGWKRLLLVVVLLVSFGVIGLDLCSS